MKLRNCRLGLTAVLLLILSACAGLDTPPDTQTQAANDVAVFTAEPSTYKLSDIKSAIVESKIGRTTSDAVVTLFFNADGKLMKGSELLPLVRDNIQARSKPLTSISAMEDLLKKHDVSIYFTDFTTFKRVMRQLSRDERISLSDYTPLEQKYVVSQKVSSIQVYTFLPYANALSAKLMTSHTASDTRSSVFLNQEEACVQVQTHLSSLLPANPAYVSEIVDWNVDDDQVLQPQQTACLASCAAGYAAGLAGCAFVPFPGNFVCAAFASIAVGACQVACRGG